MDRLLNVFNPGLLDAVSVERTLCDSREATSNAVVGEACAVQVDKVNAMRAVATRRLVLALVVAGVAVYFVRRARR